MYMEWIKQLAVYDGNEKEAMDPAQELENEMVARHKAMVEGVARDDSDIQRYYDGATVFLTGGSGFLGKQLLEKLIRACNIKKVYLLLRPKKGMQIQERLKEILEDPVYCRLLEQQPDFAERIVCLQGDVADIKLGLSEKDWSTVRNEVDIIFHVAATTKFDESLHVATLINVRGTREALLLAKHCHKLRSFVYVSTAYSHATSDKIGQPVYEQFYPSPLPPDTLIQMVETIDGDVLNELTPKLISGWPNTYTFTKAVAEEQLRLSAKGMPACIVRPSVVISAHYEPAPGWLEMSAAHSASGFLIGSGLGLIHVMQTTPSTDLSLVPVDYVNNAVIAAGWDVGTRQSDRGSSEESETKIYTVVMSQENKFTWEQLRSNFMSIRKELPMPTAIYLAYAFCVQSYSAFMLLTVLLHTIPAYLLDGVLTVLGKERRFVKIYKKIFKLSVSISYFLNTEYYLDGRNTEKLFDKLSAIDKRLFFFNMRTIDWYEYCKVWCIGVRKYLVKDGLKDTNYAKRKQLLLQYVNYVVVSIYFYALWFVISNSFSLLRNIISTVFIFILS